MNKPFGMIVCLSLVSVSACNATVGVHGGVSIPADAATTCATHCSSIGLRLSAVAIMANNVGCVCQSAPSGAVAAPGHEAGTTSGMATIAMQDAEESRRQQQKR